VNLNGQIVNSPHPSWGQCAEELLFHTSRYAYLAADFLRQLTKKPESLKGYSARKLKPAQRRLLVRLLSHPSTPADAQSLSELIDLVKSGESHQPESQKVAKCNAVKPNIVHLPTWTSGRRDHSKCRDIHPTDPILHLGRLYGFAATVIGRTVWLDLDRCLNLAGAGPDVVQKNILESLRRLSRHGYLVMNDNPDSDDHAKSA